MCFTQGRYRRSKLSLSSQHVKNLVVVQKPCIILHIIHGTEPKTFAAALKPNLEHCNTTQRRYRRSKLSLSSQHVKNLVVVQKPCIILHIIHGTEPKTFAAALKPNLEHCNTTQRRYRRSKLSLSSQHVKNLVVVQKPCIILHIIHGTEPKTFAAALKPNFEHCNTTQRRYRRSKLSLSSQHVKNLVVVQKPCIILHIIHGTEPKTFAAALKPNLEHCNTTAKHRAIILVM